MGWLKMTNYEYIKSLSKAGLAEWLEKVTNCELGPWYDWFGAKYCDNCESVMCHYGDSKTEFPCSWCELNHWACRFFPEEEKAPEGIKLIQLWMDAPYEGN